MVKNNSIKIILIKSEFHNFNEIIRHDIKGLKSFEMDNSCSIYYVNSDVYSPSWISSFFLNNKTLKDNLCNSSSKATLLVKMTFGEDERIFALVFGHGGSLINDITIEDRFGLKTALNLIGEKNIRNISKTVIGGSQKNTIEQMPKQSTIGDFEIDIDTDLINKVTGKVADRKFVRGTVTGSDSLLVKHHVDISN
ncbi:MAG: TIGR04141 family sporadically distributed protein, partial [Acholeplasmataceae bacterium]|nr:TIGR04141 family sporadically distributed protein [Acholeplasmataceae bacterium]